MALTAHLSPETPVARPPYTFEHPGVDQVAACRPSTSRRLTRWPVMISARR